MARVERLGQNKPEIVRQVGGMAVITPVNGSLKVPVLSDDAMAAAVTGGGSFAAALSASQAQAIAPDDYITGMTPERAAILVSERRPFWAKQSGGVDIDGRFDPATGWFNLRADNMQRWRKAKARMRTSATGRGEVAVIAPSTYQNNETSPAHTYSTPARIKAMLRTLLGVSDGGTGIDVPWQNFDVPGDGSFTPTVNPRFSFQRSTADGYLKFGDPLATPALPIGFYQYGGVDIKDTGPQANKVVYTPGVAGDLWAYFLETGSRSYIIERTGTTDGTYREVGSDVNDTSAPVVPQSGYLRSGSGGGGQRVAKFTPAGGVTSFRFIANGSSGFARLVGAEIKTAAGLTVHNLAMAGRALYNLFQNDNGTAGTGGPALFVRLAKADVLVIAMELNDYKGSIPLSTWYTQLKTLVQYQQAHGGPDSTGGDVVIVTNAQPDYTDAGWSPSGKAAPLSDYYAAAYRVAIECDVPLLDQAYRWKDKATSAAFYQDVVHPNVYGADDQGSDVARALASV